MKYFKCEDCGERFEVPDTMQDYVGEFWGSPAYETIAICPYCHSDEICETDDCDEAGILNEIEIEEEVEKGYMDYVTYTSDWYYDNCHGKCAKCKFHKNNKCMWEA